MLNVGAAWGTDMLTERQSAILDIIIGEYINSATPVPSSSIAQRQRLKVSSATVRNEMSELEEEGYILRRHVSGGGIPSSKGYRFHVETIPAGPGLSPEEEEYVRSRFEEVKRDMELGTRLVSEILSRLAQNMAVATFPRAVQSRIRRVELVLLQEALALLVLVMQEARTRQRLLPLGNPMTQDELATLSNKLTAVYGGATRDGLLAARTSLTPLESQVLDATNAMMVEEDARRYEEPYVSGLRHLLNQPEFQENPRLRALVGVLEDREFLKEELPRLIAGGEFRTVIGDENAVNEMQECSILVSRYGSPGGVGGLIAVIGPTRMQYRRSIGSVRLLAKLMTELVQEFS